MNSIFLLILAGIFFAALCIDLIGHIILKLKRTTLQWALLAGMIVLTGIMGYQGFTSYTIEKKTSESNLYLAYNYLLDGDGENALLKAKRVSSRNNKQIEKIELLADCVNGDYISAYFSSEQLLKSKWLKADEMNSISTIYDLTKQMMDKESGQEDSDIEKLKEKQDNFTKRIEKEIKSSIKKLSIKGKEEDKYDQIYLLDKSMNSRQLDSISYDEVMKIVKEYENDEELLRLSVKYTINNGYYKEAKDLAKQLLDKNNSVQNYVIYTDILAQSIIEGHPISKTKDKEVKELIDKAKSLDKRAEKMKVETEDDIERRDKLLNKANEYKKQATEVEVYRTINYLLSKKPILYDQDGLYDIQVAKLYLAVDEREKAKEYIYDVIKKSNRISEDSPIKEPLMQVIDAYNQSGADETSPLLKGSVHNLILAQSQDVIVVEENTINGKLANYTTSTLKYDKIGIHIGKIDTSLYPKIKAYVSVNGEKEKKFGLISSFVEKDFEMIDTQYVIKDFSLLPEHVDQEVGIAIVMDQSGSMLGTPIQDAKVAAQACVEHMDSKGHEIAIIGYENSATIITPMTDKKATLIKGIHSIHANGGTNISGGLLAGIDEIKKRDGKKAIILMSDGQDGNSPQAMEEAVRKAIQNDIVIFTVGLGDINIQYMKDIAETTGGKFILAENSTELQDIYITIQKYIVNNYCFEYKVHGNPKIDPRNLTIGITEYQAFNEKPYSIVDGIIEEVEQEYGISKVNENELTIGAISPSGLSVSDIQNGVELTISGSGFIEGLHISIGQYELQDIKIDSKTKVTGKLKGNLSTGSYSVKVKLEDGRADIKKGGIHIFRAGTTKTVLLGTHTITADVIGQTDDRSFVASGNVLINGFIHCDSQIKITAYDLPEEFDITKGARAYLGSGGAISGNGKLYISYERAKENGKASHKFANLVMGGKDYIIQNGEFGIGIKDHSSDFDLTLHNLDIKIPNMATVEIADCKLYADRLQVNIKELNISNIIENVKDGISGGVRNTQKVEKEIVDKKSKVEKREEAFKFDGFAAFSGGGSIALTADNIVVGIDIKVDVNHSIKFGSMFGLKEVEFKLNTVDEDKEYWKLAGEMDFSKIVPGFGGTGISGMKGEIASYYWYPERIALAANLHPGIPIYNILYIDELGMKIEGLSTICMYVSSISDETKNILFGDLPISAIEKKDIILAGTVEADVNLFKSFKLKVPKDMTKWGELGAIEDGEIGYNFSKTKFYAKADLSILQQELANAEIGIGKDGLNIGVGAKLDLSLLDCSIGGGVDLGLEANLQSIVLEMGVDGHIDIGFLNKHFSGDCKLKFHAELNGTYYEVEVSQGHLKARYWYDREGSLVLGKKFGAETYF